MRILSTSPLAAGSVTWQEQPDQWTLSVVCKATYHLVPGTVLVASEGESINDSDNHWDDDPRKSPYAPGDLAPYKAKPEVVLVGSAFAPRGEEARSLYVRLVIGELDKSLEVFGNRTFGNDGVLQDGPRWEQMPLRYERAAGGPDSWNPVGIDMAVADAGARRSLPNLQPPGIDVNEPGATVPVAGYGPIAAHWDVRRAKLGDLARHWSEEGWMEIPLGYHFDGSYFQSAPLDQLVEQLRPDEPIILENMHPEHKRLVTRLPGLRPRVRVEIEGLPTWELTMVADTLWIDTNRAICTLTWRGQLPLDGRDQPGSVFIGVEDEPGAPVRWPEEPADERAGTPSEELSPGDGSDILSELTNIDDHRIDEHSTPPRSRSALPFQPGPPTLPPATIGSAPPRARKAPGDPTATSTLIAPVIRGRMPTWLEGHLAAIGAGASPPPPVSSILRGAVPSPFTSLAAASDAAASFEPARPGLPLPRIPGAPVPRFIPRAPIPEAVSSAPTVGQVAMLSASQAWSTPVPRPSPSTSLSSGAARPQKRSPAHSAGSALANAAFLGAADASSAAAAIPEERGTSLRANESNPRSGSITDRPPAPAHFLLELLWHAPDAADRMREDPGYKSIIEQRREEKKKGQSPPSEHSSATTEEAEGEGKSAAREEKPFEEPARVDRADVAVVLSRGKATVDIEAALAASAGDDGVIQEKVILAFGDLELPFDEMETLKILLSAAAPLASVDKKLKEMLELASAVQGTLLGSSPEVAASFSLRVREAWNRANQMLPPDYLGTHSRRILLEQRKYQIRELSDAPWIRALLHGALGTGPVPAYLPADIARRLPLFTRFPARLAALVVPQQDQNETHPVALRVLALARQIQPRGRGR